MNRKQITILICTVASVYFSYLIFSFLISLLSPSYIGFQLPELSGSATSSSSVSTPTETSQQNSQLDPILMDLNKPSLNVRLLQILGNTFVPIEVTIILIGGICVYRARKWKPKVGSKPISRKKIYIIGGSVVIILMGILLYKIIRSNSYIYPSVPQTPMQKVLLSPFPTTSGTFNQNNK